jgi:transcriptional antiterminator NusG
VRGSDPQGGGRTEGGEALLAVETRSAELWSESEGIISGPAASPPWYVLWTHSHCEQLVHDQLAAKGFHPFLPKMDVWSVRGGRRRPISTPLFPGYLFLNDALDKAAHIEARKARGVVRILGDGWDRPALIPDPEIEAIRRLVSARFPMLPHPYLREGSRVRIVAGPLAELEGILVKVRPDKGLLVLSVNLLQRSVAVQVDCTQVVPAS